MTELQVFWWLRRVALATGQGVVVGIGDDCAVFRSRRAAEHLLFTTDRRLAGVHFRISDSPESVGRGR
jgi:thiamine monophosphate kinase